MSTAPRTIYEYLLSVRDALVDLVDDSPDGGPWEGLEIHADQRYGLRAANGRRGAAGRGTLNLDIGSERSGDWAGGDASFVGFGLTAEIALPVKAAADWADAEKRAAEMVADLREALDVIEGTNGATEWRADYEEASHDGANYLVVFIGWRSSEG